MIRVAHATDIHWFDPPDPCEWTPKRLLGLANLHLKGRRKHFDPEVQTALVRALSYVEPDVAIVSGDLTALATEAEFAIARAALQPLLDTVPTFVQPGNHDVYTREARRHDRIARFFGPWLHRDGPIGHLRHPGLTVIGLDPCRPHLTASGILPSDQLTALEAALGRTPQGDRVLLTLHYPVVDRHNAPYEHWEHGLRNARALIDTLQRSARRPDAVIHGHVHHGYQARIQLADTSIPTFNPGSGGYGWMPDQDRAACFNVYALDHEGLQAVERYRYDGSAFRPEAGGAYQTGR